MRTLRPPAFQDLIGQPGVVVLDVRMPDEFEIARLPPSRYKLGVHLGMSQRPAWSFWFPENVYDNPGGTTLGFGERVGMRDAVLPADVVPVLIEGSVADADGPCVNQVGHIYCRVNRTTEASWRRATGSSSSAPEAPACAPRSSWPAQA